MPKLKALFLFIDALEPELIIGQSHLFPNINKLIKEGASAYYDGYTNKGYNGSYNSEINWASIYTGLTPKQHKLNVVDIERYIVPKMSDYDDLQPFWEIFNSKGLSVGLWAGDMWYPPVEIDGYVVSVKRKYKETNTDRQEFMPTIHFCDKDRRISDLLVGDIPARYYPRTIRQDGYKWEDFVDDPALLQKYLENYHFQESVDIYEKELAFFFENMKRVQEEHPVDVMVFFTPYNDTMGHFSLYDDNFEVLKSAYSIFDRYLGQLLDELSPDNVFLLSDHGQKNFKDFIICEDKEIQYEAFGARNESVRMPNGNIVFYARNGSLLLSAHYIKGTFVAAGKDIRYTEIKDMRTVDIYPVLLEALDCEIPEGRTGFIPDIFHKREYLNRYKVLHEDKISYERIAIVQNVEMPLFEIILNELYYENRFVEITVIGEEKYESIFLHNPRVRGFIPLRIFEIDREMLNKFREIYVCFNNSASGKIGNIKITP